MVNIITIALAGTLSTYLVHNNSSYSAVKSSVLCTLLFIVVLHLASLFININDQYQAVFFGGSFVGMCSNKILNLWSIIVAAIFYGLLLYFSLSLFKGMGGALGTSAAITVIAIYLLNKVVRKTTQKNV